MNVLQNLTELYNQLPYDSTYRNVCSGILQNLDACAEGTIYEIAELTSSSRTTIWRMVQKMGYASFSDFHHDLRKAVTQYTYYNRILPDHRTSPQSSPKDMMIAQIQQTQIFLEQHLLVTDLEEMSEQLHRSDKISFYMPYQDCGAFSLQQNLSMNQKHTSYFCLLPDIIADSATLTNDSTVFIQTLEYAEAQDMTPAFQVLRKSGASVFMITAHDSRYQKYIDRILFHMSQKTDVAMGILLMTSYFTILSEHYRAKYID